MLAMKAAARSSDATAKPVNLRIREETRLLIDRAARAQGRSRSDFMIEAARRAAEEAILDQTVLHLDSQDYDAFLAILDKDAEGEAAAKLMAAPTPWAK
jgi:uncharacterized protein (DUF1778 family)